MKLSILSLLLIISVFAQKEVIYGEDNRLDWYESKNTMFREIALSTAAMIKKDKITFEGSRYKLKGKKLKDIFENDKSGKKCKKLRFQEQITSASCSGFLVADDMLVTAGHCITRKKDCRNYSWVFDYKLTSKIDKADSGHKDNVFNCKKIIEKKLSIFWGNNDFALIQLDRKTGRKALEINKTRMSKNTNLVVIGHPTGLPQKIAAGAKVRSLAKDYFVADLDSYGGNSGSAVFNAETGIVEGILVRGTRDYINNDGCVENNVLKQNEGRGEEVTYISNIRTLMGKKPHWWPW